MRQDGFCAYILNPPPHTALVRFWNEANGHRWTGYAKDICPNCGAYLWWKLTGIERLRVLAEKGRAA